MGSIARPQQGTQQKLEPVRSSITVTESISAETPANVSEVPSAQLSAIPGVNLDDRLRQIPGFTLFRRNSSVVANPTTQGISLRGLTSSGASRTLVLFDGVPMNDPFGGWVYWTRFTPEYLDRVEISRGAATSVFGDLAMGGAVALFSPEPARNRVWGGYEAGNQNTHDLWGGYGTLWDHWAVSLDGRGFTTDGYRVVPDYAQGAIDRRANVRFATGNARLDWFGNGHKLFAQVGILAEERGNGTYLTHNSTGLGTASLHYLKQWANDGISLIGFHSRVDYHASFSSVSADRNTERVSYLQEVPSEGMGGAALWNHSGAWWNTIVGADVNRTHGVSTDHLVPAGVRVGGGTQLQHGTFVQANAQAGDARFFGGARYQFTGEGHEFFSPSAGLTYGKKKWRARGSVYRAFRAPTLNELFREFRVGNTATLANPLLQPETLFGAEAGIDFTGESGNLRVTGFRNSLDHVITNVTLKSTATAITRQRQNAASAISRGIEISAGEAWRDFRLQAAYMYVQSRFDTGLLLSQVPRNQGSAELTWTHGRTLASASFRSYSSQFDDDRNQFLLPGFATAGLVVQERLRGRLSASLALENALDRTYYTGFTPTPTIGAPRLIRAGLRWSIY